MLVPIIHAFHWYLGVINFVEKTTVVLDLLESRDTSITKAPARQDTHDSFMIWLEGEHQRSTKRPQDSASWRAINASEWVGTTPRQGTPGHGVGVDCGLFTLAFAMELSLGHGSIETQQLDILAMRNWIGYTMLHFGKLNNTYELDQPLHEAVTLTAPAGVTTPVVKFVHKRKALTFTGSKVKMSRQIQKRTGPDILPPPELGGLRGIRNQGGTCAINTVLQACFQVPRITRLLESSRHPQRMLEKS